LTITLVHVMCASAVFVVVGIANSIFCAVMDH